MAGRRDDDQHQLGRHDASRHGSWRGGGPSSHRDQATPKRAEAAHTVQYDEERKGSVNRVCRLPKPQPPRDQCCQVYMCTCCEVERVMVTWLLVTRRQTALSFLIRLTQNIVTAFVYVCTHYSII